jgi:hypothetical protein
MNFSDCTAAFQALQRPKIARGVLALPFMRLSCTKCSQSASGNYAAGARRHQQLRRLQPRRSSEASVPTDKQRPNCLRGILTCRVEQSRVDSGGRSPYGNPFQKAGIVTQGSEVQGTSIAMGRGQGICFIEQPHDLTVLIACNLEALDLSCASQRVTWIANASEGFFVRLIKYWRGSSFSWNMTRPTPVH